MDKISSQPSKKGMFAALAGTVLFYADSGHFAWCTWIERIYAISGFCAVAGFVYHDCAVHSFLSAMA